MKFDKEYYLKDIAKILNAKYEGKPDFIVSGINEIHMVEKGDITFVDHPKFFDKALNSKASTIIINEKMECPQGKALIYSDDPLKDYLVLVNNFSSFKKSDKLISDSAQVGEGTIIQPGVFVGNNVKIGKNCLIHSNVSIYDNCILGDNVIIQANSVIGADAYYFQKRENGFLKLESCGKVVLGDNVEIGALCSIDKGVSGDTTICMNTKMDNHCQVGHDTYIGKNCLIGSHAAIAGVTRIEDDVVLWGRVSIDKDIVIGKGAVILATSGVNKSLEGNKTYFGSPVDEARKKWRELALIRKLPLIVEEFKVSDDNK